KRNQATNERLMCLAVRPDRVPVNPRNLAILTVRVVVPALCVAELIASEQHRGSHNEANGEENRDGSSNNLSRNCGAEGQTDDPTILELRERQKLEPAIPP
ncbi:MAG: hypothetical protein ACXW20_15280, partial [Burkholderiales bacterium]